MHVPCRICNATHDLEAREPSFLKPDPFLAVPPEERYFRTLDGKDSCAVRDADETNPRYFLRVLMPFSVEGLSEPYSWGIWVEVSEAHYQRVNELWDDPSQDQEPPFPARLANKLHLYPGSESLAGLVSLSGPGHIPHFHLTAPVTHSLAIEQRTGVSASRAFEWVLPVYHPEVFIQWVTGAV